MTFVIQLGNSKILLIDFSMVI